MSDETGGRGLVWLLAAKIVCCGALLLAATGALSLSAIGAWFLDGGMIWPAAGGLAIAAVYLWRQRTRCRGDRKSTRLNSSHSCAARMQSSACKKKTKDTIH